MAGVAGWLFTALVGVMIGLSMGLLGGFLQADNLGRQPGTVALFALLGLGAAALGKKGLMQVCARASERGYLGLNWTRRWAWMTAALGALVLLFGFDVLVEREGLLKLARLHGAVAGLSGGKGPAPTPDWVWYCVAGIATLGYVLCAGVEGYLRGRHAAVMDRLLWAQAEDLEARREAHRARPEVKEALAAVLAVKETLRQAATLRGRTAEAARPVEERLAAAETRRLTRREELTPEQRARIQDALDNLRGANLEFQRALDRELELMEQRPRGLLERLLGRRRRLRDRRDRR